ncbi:unnamed protein product [Phytophthora lilii]|uniref:Unnamed protein product n=1 Tax=Phytophthora lilii TaxID=2077276 RepID=A0A9W6TNG7_9STRA|nr:unnamed protein product [Phytophthora lilii]
MEVHERMQQGGDNVGVLAVSGLEPTAIVGPTAVSPINAGLVDLAQERERMAQRRLELMERKMERELAAQKRHSQEQVERLEKLHREQQQVQQEQHAQLLATIRQQQAMMLEFIKSLAPVGAHWATVKQSMGMKHDGGSSADASVVSTLTFLLLQHRYQLGTIMQMLGTRTLQVNFKPELQHWLPTTTNSDI